MLKNQYSRIDQILHKLVLGSKVVQSTSFELQRLVGPKLPKPDRPVFIVGMARSGTTTLLNLLMATGEFESSRYRDLPLPLFPALWRKVHKSFKISQMPVERAHDDGILVSPDSPEAFEEIYWQNVGDDLIEKELVKSFSQYISSIAHATGPGKRYISKNNNNVTRLTILSKICEELNGVIIIPIRNPIKTAVSSHRMHQRFVMMQDEDPFVLEYMNFLGHREFGKGLKWFQLGDKPFQPSYPPSEIDCWLEYWNYLHLEIKNNTSSRIYFVDFDAIRSDPFKNIISVLRPCGVVSKKDQLVQLITDEDNNWPPTNVFKSSENLDIALRLKCEITGSNENSFSKFRRRL